MNVTIGGTEFSITERTMTPERTYGPRWQGVQALIDRVRTLTAEERASLMRLSAAANKSQGAARVAAWQASRIKADQHGRGDHQVNAHGAVIAAGRQAWGFGSTGQLPYLATMALMYAAYAVVVEDVLGVSEFALLFGPFGAAVGGEG